MGQPTGSVALLLGVIIHIYIYIEQINIYIYAYVCIFIYMYVCAYIGRFIAISKEITLNSRYCGEYTKPGLVSGFCILATCPAYIAHTYTWQIARRTDR